MKGKLDYVEILFDSRWGDGFWKNDNAASNYPLSNQWLPATEDNGEIPCQEIKI